MARIQLDSEGLIWVLLPVLTITFLSAVVRQALNQLSMLKGAKNGGMPEMILTFSQTYTNNVTTASRLARSGARLLTDSGVAVRRKFYVGDNSDGKLCNFPAQPSAPAFPTVDPSSMLGGMKYRFVSLIMDGGLAYLISYLFAECVVARVPFALPSSFKPILQRGIAVQDLDPEFISPLSWYFVVLFSCGSFTHILNYATGLIQLGGPSIFETMNPAAAMGGGGFGLPTDGAKEFQKECDHWRLLKSSAELLANIEVSALRALGDS